MWIRLKSVKKGLTVKHQGSFCGKQNETLPEKRKYEVGGENCSLKYPWGWGGVSCTLHSHVLICQLYSCDFEWTLWASSSLKGLLLFSFFFLTSKLLRRLLLPWIPTGFVLILKQLYTQPHAAWCFQLHKYPVVLSKYENHPVWDGSPEQCFPGLAPLLLFSIWLHLHLNLYSTPCMFKKPGNLLFIYAW